MAITQTNCPTPIGVFRFSDGSTAYAPCNKWSCPHCGAVKKAQVLDRVNNGFRIERKGFRVRFLTLTLGELGENDKIGVYWNRLRASLRKQGYKGYQYFWTKETTEAGKVHMHVLLDVYVPIALIKRLWLLATENTSYVVDIRSPKGLKVKNAAAYLAKYLTKSISHPLGRGQRKYGFSRHAGFKALRRQRVDAKPEDKVIFVYGPVWDMKHYRRCMIEMNWREQKRWFRSLARTLPLFSQ